MKAVMTEVELGTEKAVETANVGSCDCDRRRHGGVIGEAFVEDLVKVVAHFGFEQDGFVDLEAETRPHAREVGFCLREAKIVCVNAGLNVIVLRERSRREANNA